MRHPLSLNHVKCVQPELRLHAFAHAALLWAGVDCADGQFGPPILTTPPALLHTRFDSVTSEYPAPHVSSANGARATSSIVCARRARGCVLRTAEIS